MSSYAFDPEELRDVALPHVGKPVPEIILGLESDLKAKYGDLIHLDMPWVINPAGYMMYQVKMIFARPNEYIGIMGVPISSTGHTGRHPVTYYDTILSGSARMVSAGEFEPHVSKAGDFLVTRPGVALAFDVPDHIFFLEYCRGPIAVLMPFGLANLVLGTLDFKSAYQLVKSHWTLAIRSRGVATPHRALS